MNLGRVLAITQKTFLSLRHDPRSLALMLVAPVMAMLVFGFAFGTEVQDVETLIVNQDEGGEAAAIIALLDLEALSLVDWNDIASGKARVSNGDATAMFVFPRNFSANLQPQGGSEGSAGVGGTPVGAQPPSRPSAPVGAEILVVVDTSNTQLAAVAQRALGESVRAYAAEKGGDILKVETEAVHAADARVIDSLVPGIMGFAALIFTTLLTLLAFVGERANGTLDRLRTTPVTEGEIVMGYVLAFGAVGAVQGILLLGAAILLFDVLVVGSVLLAGLVIVFLAVDAMAIGILVSAAASREGQAVQFIPFITLPTMLLSGVFVPVESLPKWLLPVAYLLPPTWAIEALRDVMLRGWGLERIGLHLAVLAAFAAAFIGFAVIGLKRARA